jgi:hypothetical protein
MPERTGSKMTSQILKRYDFYSHLGYVNPTDDESTIPPNVIGIPYHSHSRLIPQKYEDYTLICNMRNPYSRIFALFINFSINAIVLKKDKRDVIKEIFKKWIDTKFFDYKLEVDTPSYNLNQKPMHHEIHNWKFTDIIPDHVVRIENFIEDMSKIEFIVNGNSWKSGEILNYYQNNNFITKRNFGFDEMYDIESAKKVFFYYKNHFYLYGYDPFSFTKEQLTDEEKINFIHNPL